MKTRTVQLGEVCELAYGDSLKEENRHPGKVPVFGSNGVVGQHDMAITSGPTIVIGRKGSIGEINWSDGPCFPIDTTYYVDRALVSCDLRWLYFTLLALDLTRLNKSAAVPGLNREDAYEQLIPLPSIPEQRRIAALLEQADRLRRTRRCALELSDSFLPAAFLEMFGDLRHRASSYGQTAFGELVASTQLGLVRGAAEMHPDFEYAYLRMDSILGDGRVSFANLRRVKASDDEARDFSLNSGDFLFNTRNSRELVGKTGLVVAPPKNCLFNNNIMRIRFQDSVTPEFMMGLFQCPWLQDNLERIKSGTTSVFAVYYKDLADLPVLIPPLPLQQRFAELVRGHERLRAAQRESLRQAEHLFQSLLHRAFEEAA